MAQVGRMGDSVPELADAMSAVGSGAGEFASAVSEADVMSVVGVGNGDFAGVADGAEVVGMASVGDGPVVVTVGADVVGAVDVGAGEFVDVAGGVDGPGAVRVRAGAGSAEIVGAASADSGVAGEAVSATDAVPDAEALASAVDAADVVELVSAVAAVELASVGHTVLEATGVGHTVVGPAGLGHAGTGPTEMGHAVVGPAGVGGGAMGPEGAAHARTRARIASAAGRAECGTHVGWHVAGAAGAQVVAGGVGAAEAGGAQDVVARERLAKLSIPMDEECLALARVTAAHVGLLVGLRSDRSADLRLAVDEACALFLAQREAPDDTCTWWAAGDLELDFVRHGMMLQVAVSGPARFGLECEDVGWYLLRAMVADVRADFGRGRATVTLLEPIPNRIDWESSEG